VVLGNFWRAKYGHFSRAPKIPETAEVDGGFTTQTYGSSHADGLDAMQLEIANPIRQSASRREAFIEHLGRAIATLSGRLL
jgi:N-formylglutamate amidohydrolase